MFGLVLLALANVEWQANVSQPDQELSKLAEVEPESDGSRLAPFRLVLYAPRSALHRHFTCTSTQSFRTLASPLVVAVVAVVVVVAETHDQL